MLVNFFSFLPVNGIYVSTERRKAGHTPACCLLLATNSILDFCNSKLYCTLSTVVCFLIQSLHSAVDFVQLCSACCRQENVMLILTEIILRISRYRCYGQCLLQVISGLE